MHPKREDEIKKKELEKKSEGRAAGVMESSSTSSIIRQEDDIVAHTKKRQHSRKENNIMKTTKYTNDEMKYVNNFKDIFASFLIFLSVLVESSQEVEKEYERVEMIKDPPFL